MPDGFLAGYPFAPAACPCLHEARGVGNALFFANAPKIRKICPGVGDDSDKRQIQRTQQKRLNRVPIFVYSDFLIIRRLRIRRKDEKAKAYTAFVFPLRFDAG